MGNSIFGNPLIAVAMSAALGSALQELVYWFNLRDKLEEERYAKLLRSTSYWTIVVLMIFGAGGAALVWFAGESIPAPRDGFTFGVGLPLLIKQLGSVGGNKVHLGPQTTSYFRVG